MQFATVSTFRVLQLLHFATDGRACGLQLFAKLNRQIAFFFIAKKF